VSVRSFVHFARDSSVLGSKLVCLGCGRKKVDCPCRGARVILLLVVLIEAH
jgi:hypothetical protein